MNQYEARLGIDNSGDESLEHLRSLAWACDVEMSYQATSLYTHKVTFTADDKHKFFYLATAISLWRKDLSLIIQENKH